jgi:hypothetical protein
VQIAYEELEQYLGLRDDVIKAAVGLVDYWESLQIQGIRAGLLPPGAELLAAVDALRSWDADRGLRGPGATGEQEVREGPAQRAGDHEGTEHQG